jgi:flotillin
VTPVKQKARVLSLALREAEIVEECITNQGIRLNIRAVAAFKVGDDQASIANAARRFLSEQDRMEVLVGRVFAGHLRSIIGGLTVEQIIRERDRVAQEVKDGSHGEVEKLGIVVDALEIQEIEDSSGYISNLATPHAAAVASQARIAKARADQEATERELAAASMKAQFERDAAIKRAGFLAETDEAHARAVQAGPLAEAQAAQQVIQHQTALAQRKAELAAQRLEAEANTARAASLREGNQELIAANRLVEILPGLVDAAARGLAGSNLTILNGTQGVNEVVVGLVGQGLSILEALKKSASVNGVVTGTVAGPGPMTAAASTPSIEAD